LTPTIQQRRPPLGLFRDKPAPRLYDRIVEVPRVRHYSRRTEEAHIHWIRRYIEFHQHRHPRQLDESLFSRSLKAAVRKAGLTKRVTSHTFRHSFATHLLADGYNIRTVQEPLGHKDVRTTMIYTHVLNRGGRGVRGPADGLARGPDER